VYYYFEQLIRIMVAARVHVLGYYVMGFRV